MNVTGRFGELLSLIVAVGLPLSGFAVGMLAGLPLFERYVRPIDFGPLWYQEMATGAVHTVGFVGVPLIGVLVGVAIAAPLLGRVGKEAGDS